MRSSRKVIWIVEILRFVVSPALSNGSICSLVFSSEPTNQIVEALIHEIHQTNQMQQKNWSNQIGSVCPEQAVLTAVSLDVLIWFDCLSKPRTTRKLLRKNTHRTANSAYQAPSPPFYFSPPTTPRPCPTLPHTVNYWSVKLWLTAWHIYIVYTFKNIKYVCVYTVYIQKASIMLCHCCCSCCYLLNTSVLQSMTSPSCRVDFIVIPSQCFFMSMMQHTV